MTSMLRSISVVIPVYNSETTLRPLVERLEPVLKRLAPEYEVLLINDGSKDASWKVISELAGGYSFVRGINLMRNYGQHNAVLCGIRDANCEVVITMDDDLQHPPEEIPKLLSKLAEGYDVVYGQPQKEQHGLWRNLASVITKISLQAAIGATTARSVSALRAFRTTMRDAFANYQSPFVSVDVLLTWGSTKFAAIAVRYEPRQAGTSNYTFGKLVLHALNMMTGFSTLPLRLASAIGFAFTVLGFGILCFVSIRYVLHGNPVPGFPFLASIIALFSGAQLFCLGIIGEYLSRMHFRSMERPTYAISSFCQQASCAQDLKTTQYKQPEGLRKETEHE